LKFLPHLALGTKRLAQLPSTPSFLLAGPVVHQAEKMQLARLNAAAAAEAAADI
jgi:hypothetical protein